MNRKEVLKELIDYLYDFENEVPEGVSYTLTDFIGYLNTSLGTKDSNIRDIAGTEEEWLKDDNDVNTDISTLLVFVYRYATVYFKKALKVGNINTLDEFSFLIVLMTYPSLSKTELIQKMILEITSGIEVIKRLLRNDLIEEFPNPNDKRSVLVAITEKGKKELIELIPQMGLVGSVIVGNLKPNEVRSLLFLLRKLDYYHNDIFLNHKDLSLQELEERKMDNLN